MKLGIYGGTFNPPHTGHLTAARSALEALELDRLVLLPAAQPPHKVLPPGAPSAEQRLDMTAIAADALLLPGRVEASALELKRPGVSYTADTLRQLREQEPDAQLWLLMGADMFLSFQNWREPDVIARLAGICAFARTPDAPEQALELAQLLAGKHGHVNLIPVNPIKERSYAASRPASVHRFQNILEKNGINVTIRRELGADIDGACGQLRRRYKER